MVISINKQLMLILLSLISGLIIGVMFDIYRLIRGIESPNKVITFIEDILFWVLNALVVFIFLFLYDYAYIGFYVYLCIIAGLGIYLKFLSRFLIKVLFRIFNAIGKSLRILKNIVLYPVEVIIYYIRGKYKEN